LAKDEEKEKAKKLYIRENKEVQQISQLLNISEGTIYRWKKEDKEDNKDWDDRRNIWNFSPVELEKVYLESVKELVLKCKDNPDLMLDSKVADAMSKHISNLKKMNPAKLSLGVGLEVLKIIDEYFQKQNEKKLRAEFARHFEGLRNELIRYYENQQ
jgi:transposase-like protein